MFHFKSQLFLKEKYELKIVSRNEKNEINFDLVLKFCMK